MIAAVAVVLVVLAASAIPFLGGEFLPPLREGHFIVHMVAMPGTSLEESFRLGKLVTDELLKDEDVRVVAQQIGRAESGDDTAGVHYSEIHVDLKLLDGDAMEGAEERLREVAVGDLPQLDIVAPKLQPEPTLKGPHLSHSHIRSRASFGGTDHLVEKRGSRGVFLWDGSVLKPVSEWNTCRKRRRVYPAFAAWRLQLPIWPVFPASCAASVTK